MLAREPPTHPRPRRRRPPGAWRQPNRAGRQARCGPCPCCCLPPGGAVACGGAAVVTGTGPPSPGWVRLGTVPAWHRRHRSAPFRPFGSRSGSKPSPGAPIHAPKGARPGSLPARASPGDPRLGPLPPAGVPSRQPARHPGRRGRVALIARSRFADPRRRRPLDGVRLAPVTCGAAQQRGPPGCSPVPGEASLVREATVGRRCPERSMGGLSAGTIQVPAGRGTGRGPAARRGCALRGLGNPGWPRRVDDWAPVTNRLGTPQFGGQCVGGYRGARRGDRGWCHDGEPRPPPTRSRPTADRVHGNAKAGRSVQSGGGERAGTAMRWAISGSGLWS